MKKIKLSQFVKIDFTTPQDQNFKFGYYNFCPLDKSGTKLLAHKIGFNYREPTSNDVVEIGYFSIKENKWYKLTETKAFNWQQGSMLQWLGPDFSRKIIFNDYHEGKYLSKIFDIQTKKIKIIPFPIYAVDKEAKFALALDFERLFWTRGYSYYNIKNNELNRKIYKDESIYKINLEEGDITKIITISDIISLTKNVLNDSDSHWFEHIQLNPNSNRFSFYYRYGTGDSFQTKIFTSDINGKNIWQHPSKSDSLYSHLGWRSETEYVLFTYPRSNIGKLYDKRIKSNKLSLFYSLYKLFLRPLIPQKLKTIAEGNKMYQLTEDKKSILKNLDSDLLSKDGHPSFTKNGRFMLSDTYSDKDSFRHLYIHDMNNNKIIKLAKFNSVANNCDWRTDLHPRFSMDEKKIIIDSNHNGKTQMLVLTIEWDKIL